MIRYFSAAGRQLGQDELLPDLSNVSWIEKDLGRLPLSTEIADAIGAPELAGCRFATRSAQ